MSRLLLILVLPLLAGCSFVGTVTPNAPKSSEASIGPNGAHSLIYAWRFDGNAGQKRQLWYPEKRDDYNVYIAQWGKQFTPALTPDFHLSRSYSATQWIDSATGQVITARPGFWEADGEAISTDTQLVQLKRKAQAP